MAEVIDAPPAAEPLYVSPQAPKTDEPKSKVGEKGRWQAEFDKITQPKTEEATSTATPETTKTEQVTETKEDTGDKTQDKSPTKAVDKPASPLDVVIADKKPEVKEPDPVEEFDDKNPDWKRARQLMRTQRDEKKSLETSIAELKKTPKADPEQITKLSQERDALKQSLAEREELIKSVDVRLSEDYRVLAKKRDDTVQKIGDRAKSYGVDPAAFISALALPEGKYKTEQIDTLMAEVAPSYQAKINILVDKLEEHNEALNEFERDAPKKYEEIQAKRQVALQEQQEASVKAIHAEFGKITEALPSDVVTLREVPDDVPGGTEWNQAIKTARENALRILSPGGSDFNESAAIAYKGAHYDALMNMFLKDHTELVDSRKRLAEYDSGGPDFKGGAKPKTEVKLTPGQKYHKTLEQIQGSPTE